MTNSEKWNIIVAEHNILYSKTEAYVQNAWETYCSDLFDYKRLFHEIDSQRHLTVGSGGSIIPDIILRVNDNDIFDIELKQYSLPFDSSFETQLISYLNQTHLSVGMIVCNKIYLYYYEYATIKVSKIEIPFEKDNKDGIALMDILTKDGFSADRVKEFVFDKLNHKKRIGEIRKLLTNDWIKDAVIEKLLTLYSQEDIDEAIEKTVFKASNSLIPAPVSPFIPSPNTPNPINFADAKYGSNIIEKWCLNKTQSGDIKYLTDNSTTKYERYTTEDFDTIFPYQAGLKSGWKNGYFYAYEIVNTPGQIKTWIALSNKNAPEDFRNKFNRILVYLGKRLRDNWDWTTFFSTKTFTYSEQTTEEEIFKVLDMQFFEVREKMKALYEYLRKE